jgi:hypothetical protein
MEMVDPLPLVTGPAVWTNQSPVQWKPRSLPDVSRMELEADRTLRSNEEVQESQVFMVYT